MLRNSLFILSLLAVPGLAFSSTILIVGDSLSASYGIPVEQGWVALLQQRLSAQCGECTIVNASISGDTTGGGLRGGAGWTAARGQHRSECSRQCTTGDLAVRRLGPVRGREHILVRQNGGCPGSERDRASIDGRMTRSRMTEGERRSSARPGPVPSVGSPSGPDEVRRAVLDAAAILFATRGVGEVSLRDIASAAHTHVALIDRYIGNREQLELAVFDDLSVQLARSVADHPLSGQGHGVDTVMGKWSIVTTSLVIRGRELAGRPGFNPVTAMARTLAEGYGLEPLAARLRAAQIVALAIGWRVFEDYLVSAGDLDEVTRATLREELVHSARRIGATPWPSPPDPTPRSR